MVAVPPLVSSVATSAGFVYRAGHYHSAVWLLLVAPAFLSVSNHVCTSALPVLVGYK